MILPTGHPNADATDLQAMIELLLTNRFAESVAGHRSTVDLREVLASLAIQANCRLWQDAGGSQTLVCQTGACPAVGQ